MLYEVITTSAFMLILVLVGSWNFGRIIYFYDTLRGQIIDIFDLYERPDGGVRIVDFGRQNFMKKTYEKLPDSYFHMGNSLFYIAEKNISLSELADQSIEYTDYYKIYTFKNSLRSCNSIAGDVINRGEKVLINNSIESYVPDLFV